MPDTCLPHPLPNVHQLRVVVRGVSPLIWRRLLIPFEDLVVWLVTRSDKSTVAGSPGSPGAPSAPCVSGSPPRNWTRPGWPGWSTSAWTRSLGVGTTSI